MRRVLAFARACPAASPPIPCAAACSCLCPPCCERPARGSFRGWSDHTNLAHTRIAGRATRRPKRARAMPILVYDADARPPSPAPRRSKTRWGEGNRPKPCLSSTSRARTPFSGPSSRARPTLAGPRSLVSWRCSECAALLALLTPLAGLCSHAARPCCRARSRYRSRQPTRPPPS